MILQSRNREFRLEFEHLLETMLHFLNAAAHRVDHAAEFDQHPIADGLDDLAAMLGELRVGQLVADRLQRGERALLIRPISREYPATSAARIAASRRSTRSLAKPIPPL